MANVKFTDLPENTAPTGDDIAAIVNDPTGTPTSMKVKLVNLLKQIFLADQTQLSFNTVTNGEFLKRVGSNIDSAVAVVPGAVTTSGLTQATARILGRTTALTGAIEEISAGTGITLSGGTISSTGGGSSVPTTAQGDTLYASAANTLTALAKDTNATRYLSNTGATNNPAWAQVALTTGVTGVLPVANGGTNASSASITAFNNITGFTAAGSTGTTSTNIVFSTSPTLVTPLLGTPTSGNLSNCTADGTDEVGFRNIPVNSQSTAYSTVIGDRGKCVLHPVADNNPRTFTIDGSLGYAVGTAITFVNMVNTLTIAISTDTLTLMGAGTTGSRSLAASNVATAVKIASGSWIISGSSGLT